MRFYHREFCILCLLAPGSFCAKEERIFYKIWKILSDNLFLHNSMKSEAEHLNACTNLYRLHLCFYVLWMTNCTVYIPQRQFAVKCHKAQQLPELFLPQRNCYTVVMEELHGSCNYTLRSNLLTFEIGLYHILTWKSVCVYIIETKNNN